MGTPLTWFVLAGLVVSLWVPLMAPKQGRPLSGLDSREGFLTLVAWVLLALAALVIVAVAGLIGRSRGPKADGVPYTK